MTDETHETATSPAWPALKLPYAKTETHRLYPHTFTRTSLFSSRKFSGGAKRDDVADGAEIKLESISTYAVEQVGGQRLDQGDLAVYTWMLDRAYKRGLAGLPEAVIFFTIEEAIAGIGKSRGAVRVKLLQDSLRRLFEAEVKYTTPHATGVTRLISSIEKPLPGEKKPYDFVVVVSARVGDFFLNNDFNLIKNTEREKLDYLGLWLHAFYDSHETDTCFLYTTALIKKLADREDTPEHVWRKKLAVALEAVKAAAGWRMCQVVEKSGEKSKIQVVKGDPPKRKKAAT